MMLAKTLARQLSRMGIHYGWVMVALAFITTIGWSAAISLPGVLIVPITAEFGWSRADVSGAIAVMFVLFACVAPFSGALMLRYGVARVAAVSAALVVAGLLATMLVFARWHLSVGIGLFLGIAAGMVGLSLPATIASRWFVARRGLVVGVLTASFAAGQLTFLPAAAWLSTTYGWRMAVLPVLICAAICVVLFLLLGRDWPADVDLPPYGEKRIAPQPPASASGAISLSLSALKEASTVPLFWVLAGTFFVCGLSSTGIVNQHFVPFCADYGIGAVAATSYLAIMGVFNFIGTIGSGWLTDRFDNRALLAIYYGARGLLLIWLPFSNFDVLALTMWAIFFGLDFVATVPPTVRLAGQYFGAVKGPVLFGWIFAAHQLGSAVAAFGSGVTRDSVLSYLPAFMAAGIVCFLTVALIAMIRTPSRPVAA
jgi:predicted MFS family arabinose efflux permease